MSLVIENLLNLKRWREDEAKNAFAMALKEVAIEEDKLRNLEDSLQKIMQDFDRYKMSEMDIDSVKRTMEYQDLLIKQIAIQKKKILEKEKIAERARQQLAEATREKKIFQRLQEKQMEAERKRLLRLQQGLSDESASTRFEHLRFKYSDED